MSFRADAIKVKPSRTRKSIAGRAAIHWSLLMQWDDLQRELALWAEAGRAAPLWWRDDDAVDATPALARLIDLAMTRGVDVGLAAIPALATEALAEAVDGVSRVAVLQHGYSHRNYAAAGKPAVECGGERAVEATLAELTLGRRRMQELFNGRFMPVLAAPWNNIDDDVALRLDECNFTALSAYGPRARQPHAASVTVANAHVDPLNWRAGGRFAGTEKALSGIVGELRARRTGATEWDEPLGLLTHHLNHDSETWDFLDRLFLVTRAETAVQWLSLDEVFPSPTSAVTP
jgi:hypothetical protein